MRQATNMQGGRRRKRWSHAAVCVLALAVLLVTTVRMMLPAYTERKATFCGMEEHEHVDACYEETLLEPGHERVLACELPEHVHDSACYSDPDADVETEGVWQQTLPEEMPEAPAEALAAIARTQLGYRESERNYEVREDGSLAGYTRYGAWSGTPYGEWNAAFAMFCVQHAGIGEDAVPRANDVGEWIDALRECEMFEDAPSARGLPMPGDLAFLDEGAPLVGIVSEADEDANEFVAIVGDCGGAVCERRLAVTDEAVLGFGVLPDDLRPEVQACEAEDGEPAEAMGEDVDGAEDSTGEVQDAAEAEVLPEPDVGDAPTPAEKPLDEDLGQDDAAHDNDAPRMTRLSADVDGLRVTVEASLPGNADYKLAVKRVNATKERVRQVEESQSEELPGGITRRADLGDDALFLDLRIEDAKGSKVEPDVAVKVRVAHTGPAVDAGEPPTVVHFARDGVEELDAEATKDGFEFRTDGFSVFAFAYTVDFYYEGYEYHLGGGEVLSVADLLAELHIAEDAQDVADVRFSDTSLVEPRREESGWVLVSKAPFDTEETLTVAMQGGATYVIRVEDAKSYTFQMNVNDVAGGCVYERNASGRYGPEVMEAVTDAGVAASWVRPRSADEPTNGNLSATRGFHFVGWRINGYVDYGMGRTGDGVGKGDLYSILPSTAEDLVADGWQTFTACFVPDGEFMVTFDRYIWADENGSVNGSVVQGGAKSYTYRDVQRVDHPVYYCYSGAAYGALAIPNDDSKFVGWYISGTNTLVCDSQYFVAPDDLSQNVTVQARFVKADLLTVRYYSYDAQAPGTRVGTINIGGTDVSGTDVTEQVYEQRVPSGATAADRNGYSFVAWRDEGGRIVSRTHELALTDAVTQDVTYGAEYLRTGTRRMLFTVEAPGTGSVNHDGADKTDQWLGAGNYSTTGDWVVLNKSATAVPKEGYRFHHWELNGQELATHAATVKTLDAPYDGNHIQELTAVFVPVCTITYDLGKIQQVGNNTPDFQHWESVPWCSKDVEIDAQGLTKTGDDTYQTTLDYNATVTMPDLVHNDPAGDATIRVTQTNNGYNLLTHTFKGWRFSGSDTVYPPGSSFPAIGSYTLEAVWDAYLPGKRGYYGTGSAVNRLNTNTCGFFVRLFDGSFDIGNTNTYTDCLFTSRIFLGGDSLFATNDNVGGLRFDFFGNSDAVEREQIDTIDSLLRSLANTSIPYSEEYSGQRNGTAYPGSLITFEQPFPSDEFIFGRIRQWNAAAPANRKIQINGTVIDQDKLTSDYFDLRWYVLKDQENSWHVDGMLIPKYAKLVVRKRFEGVPEAVQGIKGRSDFYIGVDQSRDATEEKTETYKLRLHEWSEDDPKDDLGYVRNSRDEYEWVIDTLEPLTSYWVGEHGYIAKGNAYTTTKTIHLDNTDQDRVDVTNSYRMQVDEVLSYPDDATTAEIQTITFTNRYTQPRELVLAKLDATTNNPLADVPFTFSLLSADGSRTLAVQELTTDASGQITVTLPNPVRYDGRDVYVPDGTYRFSLAEQAHEGYVALPGPITGTVALSSTQASDITLDASVTADATMGALVSLGASDSTKLHSVMYVKNEPRTKRVEVTKHWTNAASTPVTMQLLRNGVPLFGKSARLDATNDWTCAWDELPAYIDGDEAVYTVREEWIGEAGGVTSVHYNASADADGYEDYIVTQSQSVSVEGDVTVSSVYVENTPNSGQAVFAKVDDVQKAVVGAEFTVYSDAACDSPITAADYVAGTDSVRPAVFTSDAKGMVTIEGLNPGTYHVRETKAPAGYSLGKARVYTLTVGSKSSTMTYVDEGTEQEVALTKVENPVYTREVTLHKVAAGGTRPLAGAVFSLHGTLTDGTMDPVPLRGLAGLTSGADGRVSLGSLRVGEYYLVEDVAPKGFNRLQGPVRITVPGDDATPITAIRVDGNTGMRVEGNDVYVPNSEGAELPQSGSRGVESVYRVGVALTLIGMTGMRFRRRGAGQRGGEES